MVSLIARRQARFSPSACKRKRKKEVLFLADQLKVMIPIESSMSARSVITHYTLHTHTLTHTLCSSFYFSLFLSCFFSLIIFSLSLSHPVIFSCILDLLCSHWNVLHLKLNGDSNQHNLILIKIFYIFIFLYLLKVT